ncbi:methionyl-tRNA formyltransferase [Hazenella coriacea]|nr:methionyl-tRNA formyltransferase [Hazenella coriacea]
MGTPDFAVPSLTALIQEKYDVVTVVTQPDRPKGRKKVITPTPVKVVAERYGIPVFQPEKLRDPVNVEKVLSYQPDLIVTAAYGQILPESLLKVPKYGCINVHASLLPKYRGGAPIHQAIIDGEEETGVTIMYMVKALDAGDMIAQRAIPITETDHVGTMHDKLSQVGAELLTETLPPLLKGELTPIAQDETQVTYAPNIKRDDEKIDWSRSAKQLTNQIRGLHPWPVAFTVWHGKPFKIWWAHVLEESADAIPGTVKRVDEEGIVVSTGEGCLKLTDIQPAGKKRMSVSEFIRGHQMEAGERLGDE